jgi:hypothetical protein
VVWAVERGRHRECNSMEAEHLGTQILKSWFEPTFEYRADLWS